MPGIRIRARMRIGIGPEPVQGLLITSLGVNDRPTGINMSSSEADNVITLGPNAAFYTDEACTRDASRTWTLPIGETPDQRYLKCALGTATFIASKPDKVFIFIVVTGEAEGNTHSFSGNIEMFPFLYQLAIPSNNTLSGSIAGLTNLTDLEITGNNTLSGSVAGITGLQYLTATGNNTISGDISNVLDTMDSEIFLDPCAMTAYTSGSTWPNQNVTINPSAGYGYSSTEIDNMLIDMAASGVSGVTITLQGSNAWRTPASDAAGATLVGNGCLPFVQGVLTLTAQGDGDSVATLTMVASENTTIEIYTLVGAAKFYSDSEGTLDESSTWAIISGAERTIYVKCTSGTAYFIVEKNTITEWIEWNSDSSGPSIGGNIEGLTNLEVLNVENGNNSLYGDISLLTNLEFFNISGEAEISGSISELTNLVFFSVVDPASGCTITGDITELTNLGLFGVMSESSSFTGSIAGLTNLYVFGIMFNNTISGSITGLTSLEQLWVGGNNTLTGSINGLTSLKVLAVGGNNTISGDVSSMLDTKDGDLYLNPCAMVTYTEGEVWSNNNVTINPSVGYGYSSTEIDNMLIDMANSGVNGVTITLQGSNAWRTTDSDVAVATLVSSGCTVFTNGVLLLTSQEDGTGTSTLTLETSENTLITLGPNARFYTNAGGTLGASRTWNVLSGAERTMYVKCTGGTATFEVQTNTITKWVEWNGGGNNSPNIGGDIGGFTNLTDLVADNYNTLSGNISRLTGLAYLEVAGDNTLTGSVAGLTNLIVLEVGGNNSLSGSIAGLTNLTYLDVEGEFTTLSGSVAGLTSLTFLGVYNIWAILSSGPDNNNTISGNIEGLTNLVTLLVTGNNTLTGSIEGLSSLKVLAATGNNTISGDFSVICSGFTELIFLNSCAMTTYTSGATWANMNVTINPSAGYGYSSTEIDNMLIDMANSGMNDVAISLLGSSSWRTGASDAAVATLEGNSCIIYTNTDMSPY